MDHSKIESVQKAFSHIGIAQLHDVAEKYLLNLSEELAITHRSGSPRFCGPVFPVKTDAGALPILQALAQIPPGNVLLIYDALKESFGLIGDIIMSGAIQRKVAGVIVRGAIRDCEELMEMGISVYSTSVSAAKLPYRNIAADEVPASIRLRAGVLAPGDWIFSDRDGVVALPVKKVRPALVAAQIVRVQEGALRDRLNRGQPFAEVMGLDERLRLSATGPC